MQQPNMMESFPCREPGCNGIITKDPQLGISIQTSCSGSSLAARCPQCGRLHWPETGESVQSRSFEKVFSLDGESLTNRPPDSKDKLEAVDGLVKGSENGELIPEYYRDKLKFLAELGHAADCPSKDGPGECICGCDEANKWLSEHAHETKSA